MCDNKEDLNLWIENFIQTRHLSKYKLSQGGNSRKGDGYLGEICFVKVLAGEKEEKQYDLVIKSTKKNEELRRKSTFKDIFQREVFIYTRVFPTFRKFQLEHSVEKPFNNYPNCYNVYSESQAEAIILQDLRSLQYEVHDRKLAQNMHHALLVFENYAKFHAISLGLKKQKPQTYKHLTEDMHDVLANMVIGDGMVEAMTRNFQEGLELLKHEDPQTHRKLLKFNKNGIEEHIWKVKDAEDDIAVILHGDCWNNNMMFMYKDKSKEKPFDMKFLDFQLSSVGSPIYDLSYYLYAVADEQLLNYFDVLLQKYHETLTNVLQEEFREQSHSITFDILKKHWKLYASFGLVVAPSIVKIEISDVDEVKDLNEVAKTGDVSSLFEIDIKNKDLFAKRIKAVFKHYATFL